MAKREDTMPITEGVDKAVRLAQEIKTGTVLEHPKCKCGWTGTEPAIVNAGCPNCGARLS